MMQMFDAVVVSDLHLGAHNSRAEDFLRFIDSIETRKLILNGDVFDSYHFRRITPDQLRALDAIRAFARHTEVIWIQGNHDPEPAFASAVLGIEYQRETLLEISGKPYLITHGDQWDASMHWPAWMIHSADAVYYFSQWIDPSHKLARSLKRRCKRFCKAVDNLQNSAVNEARKRNLAGVVLGHTHIAKDVMIDGVHYLNSGCWTEKPSSFIGVRDGVARHLFYESIQRRQTAVQLRSRIGHPSFAFSADVHSPTPMALGE